MGRGGVRGGVPRRGRSGPGAGAGATSESPGTDASRRTTTASGGPFLFVFLTRKMEGNGRFTAKCLTFINHGQYASRLSIDMD
jgi:hypothetical protein